jgi:hypothetical protein
MNCFSPLHAIHRRWLWLAGAMTITACGVPASESADRMNNREYSVHYALRADPGASTVHVTMTLRQPEDLLRELTFAVDSSVSRIAGDGEVRIDGDRAYWFPAADGGELRWQVVLLKQRGNKSVDAYLGPDWGVFRAEDVIPRARTRTLQKATSRTTMSFELPRGWSAISEYSAKAVPIVVDRPERRFDQPTGWIAMGELGVRRESIAGVKVAVAAPQGSKVRRMEMLALLNWTLPELAAILPDSLSRLTIVSAGEPMWRGGLSAPASFFIHAERPLISENATSPLLHEVMHTALPVQTREGFDWIAEGLAEYYSISLLRRGRAITEQRAKLAFERQAEWGGRAELLCSSHSTGAETALAVTILKDLDAELTEVSGGEVNLDSLLPFLTSASVDVTALATAARELTGVTPDALHIDNLPGCRSMPQGDEEN